MSGKYRSAVHGGQVALPFTEAADELAMIGVLAPV